MCSATITMTWRGNFCDRSPLSGNARATRRIWVFHLCGNWYARHPCVQCACLSLVVVAACTRPLTHFLCRSPERRVCCRYGLGWCVVSWWVVIMTSSHVVCVMCLELVHRHHRDYTGTGARWARTAARGCFNRNIWITTQGNVPHAYGFRSFTWVRYFAACY